MLAKVNYRSFANRTCGLNTILKLKNSHKSNTEKINQNNDATLEKFKLAYKNKFDANVERSRSLDKGLIIH